MLRSMKVGLTNRSDNTPIKSTLKSPPLSLSLSLSLPTNLPTTGGYPGLIKYKMMITYMTVKEKCCCA
jgi:hypothetical protein